MRSNLILKLAFLDELSPAQILLREIAVHFKYRLLNLLKYRALDSFYLVGIETITYCNRACAYCPNSLHPKDKQLMSPELFTRIIDDLAKLKFSGILSPYFYGEPLLDERLPKFLGYAKQKLPGITLYLHTNGDLLTKTKFQEMRALGVKKFFVTHHENKPPQKFMEWFLTASLAERQKIIFKKLNKNSALSNRGGLVKINRKIKTSLFRICRRPKVALFIDVTGNVILCCNDYFGRYTFGNVKEKSIMDIWKDKDYKQRRNEVSRGKFTLEICKKCVS